MKLLEFIKEFFTTGDIMETVAKVLATLVITAMYFVVFYYARKRNLQLVSYIFVGVIVALFFIALFDIPNIQFYVYFVFFALFVAAMHFFAQDFRKDIFLKAWNNKHDFDAEDLGRADLHKSVTEIIKACQRLSKTDTGALIIVGSDIPDSITDSGVQIQAEISADLLETIFFPKTNLHDGAVVIMANKVVCAGCYLPMTQDANLPREFGSRHRAAIALSESNSDLTVIVVSEETGIISAMHNGKVKRYLDAVQLKLILDSAMGLLDVGAEETIWGLK
ncbi:MAG: diadenylate cyclase [Clostridia bacterium]|nr:diadenylate cyclase [Clostridia bacterium]